MKKIENYINGKNVSVSKKDMPVYDPSTGEEKNDKVTSYELTSVANEIKYYKSKITKMQEEQADWEQLEKDLKAL